MSIAEEGTAYSDKDWTFLVNTAQSGTPAAQGVVVDGLRRVVVALAANEKSATVLGTRIWWLNRWLLVFTIAILVLTAVQVWITWRGEPLGQVKGRAAMSEYESYWKALLDDALIKRAASVGPGESNQALAVAAIITPATG